MIVKALKGDPARTWCLVFETGDEVVGTLEAFARERKVESAHFQGIGAFRTAVLAYFDPERKAYLDNPVEEQVECVSFIGNVTRGPDGGPAVHAHVAIGRRDGHAVAGHLVSGIVRPTLEVFLTETGEALGRQPHEATALDLIR